MSGVLVELRYACPWCKIARPRAEYVPSSTKCASCRGEEPPKSKRRRYRRSGTPVVTKPEVVAEPAELPEDEETDDLTAHERMSFYAKDERVACAFVWRAYALRSRDRGLGDVDLSGVAPDVESLTEREHLALDALALRIRARIDAEDDMAAWTGQSPRSAGLLASKDPAPAEVMASARSSEVPEIEQAEDVGRESALAARASEVRLKVTVREDSMAKQDEAVVVSGLQGKVLAAMRFADEGGVSMPTGAELAKTLYGSDDQKSKMKTMGLAGALREKDLIDYSPGDFSDARITPKGKRAEIVGGDGASTPKKARGKVQRLAAKESQRRPTPIPPARSKRPPSTPTDPTVLALTARRDALLAQVAKLDQAIELLSEVG